MSGGEFLLEVLCEEIPANALPDVRAQLAAGYRAALAEAGFLGFEVASLSTVRRLIVSVSGLPETQPDRDEEVTGPPVKAAYSGDGSPTQAALGFAKALGVEVGDLRVVKGPKGDVIAGTRHLQGRPTPEVLGEATASVFAGLRFPKTMRWGCGEHLFVRPVHNVAALFGMKSLRTLVPVKVFGVAAGTSTVGHRVIAPERIELAGCKGLSDYVARMRHAGVVVDPGERLRRLSEQAARLAAEVGCEVRPDADLIAEHVELIEHPGVVRGEIEARFLELPEEVLITTLRHHQKCLVLQRDGKVAPYFLAVADRADDPEGHVRRGNEWVSGARLTDASFFFAQDRKTPLEEHAKRLDGVLVHQKLGTYADKAKALVKLMPALAVGPAKALNEDEMELAARLAKADLVTAMVGEFPELQGVVGGIYARLDGVRDIHWQAVYDQYRPAGLDGPLPRGPLGVLLGVADRLDTLAGMFAAGEIPSGSKDPFGLRRAALAVVRICAETNYPLHLTRAVERALQVRSVLSAGAVADANNALSEFMRERVRFYLTAAAGVSGPVADAVLEAGWDVVPEAVARARALEAVRQEPVFADLAVVFKRVRNLVSKSGAGKPADDLLREPAETALLAVLTSVEASVTAAVSAGDHGAGLRALAQLAAPLDRFFTDVLVLCDDARLRDARLALLARVEALFLRLADPSRLTPQN